jgi:hypothetical protein
VGAALTPSRAADIFFAVVGHVMYRLLVLGRGSTVAAWQSWLVDNLEHELFDEPDSRPRPRSSPGRCGTQDGGRLNWTLLVQLALVSV